MWGHIRRITVGLVFIVGIAVLALVIDSVVVEFYELGLQFGVDDGPFSGVHSMAGNVMILIVPFLLVGVILWILVGPIQQTRREEERRLPRR